ncbi:MAG: hypothetical protein ABIQ88_20665 [Chitinophagaceae bacterium]
MKKLISIFFLTLYLLSTTEFHQLLKLPVVFQHFEEHKAENSRITFLQFLDIHYMHGSPIDNDYDRDMQLPFKNGVDCISAVLPAFVPLYNQHSIPEPIAIPVKKIFVLKNQFLSSSYLSRIWQPPRYA